MKQCLPKAASDLDLSMSFAASSSVVAKTRDDLWVVSSSSLGLSQRGLETIDSSIWAYCGLHSRSSV